MQPTADIPTSPLTGAALNISEEVGIQPGMVLPLPDDAAAAAARDRLTANDIGVSAPTIAALGMMAEAVIFIAGVQNSAYPRPLLSTRVVLLSGSHAGGVVAGPAPDPRNGVPLQHLAMNAGAGVVTLEWQPAAAAIELEDAITADQVEAALQAGWAEAERAADEGIELLVLAAGGAGAATAAAAVVAAVTGAEPPALLARAVTPAGLYDDNAWMVRCLALRDALHRVRQRDGDPRTVLAALGGADIAAATGLILGAASRRTPVMIDGPVGAAAALVANDFSPQSRSWVVLPDTGRHPAVRLAAEALQLRPWLDLCLELGEGASALAALPLLQTALTIAGSGEPVETASLSRIDATGGQIFVGVAKPVEPTEDLATSDTSENATVDGASTKPEKPAKKAPAKPTSAKTPVKGPTRTSTPPKSPTKATKPAAKAPAKSARPAKDEAAATKVDAAPVPAKPAADASAPGAAATDAKATPDAKPAPDAKPTTEAKPAPEAKAPEAKAPEAKAAEASTDGAAGSGPATGDQAGAKAVPAQASPEAAAEGDPADGAAPADTGDDADEPVDAMAGATAPRPRKRS